LEEGLISGILMILKGFLSVLSDFGGPE